MKFNLVIPIISGLVVCLMALGACGSEPIASPAPGLDSSEPIATPAPGLDSNTPEAPATTELAALAVVELDGSAFDETLPFGPLRTEWSLVSGPGEVVFADSSRVDTTATFSTMGTYVLRLTATDGEFTVSDEVTVVVQR